MRLAGLGNVLNYYGSKIMLAQYMPRHAGRVVEPFAGGAGYSLATCAESVRLHDLDEHVCAAWGWFLGATPAEILDLPLLAPGDDVYDAVADPGARALVGYWLNKSAAPCRTLSKWGASTAGTVHEACFWSRRRRALLAETRARIGDWSISQTSYETSWRGPDWLYFVDPPYQIAGKHYRHGSAGFDFGALADWCRWVAGKGAPIVVCENAGADWMPFDRVVSEKHHGAGSVAGKRRAASEVAWSANCAWAPEQGVML